MGAIVGIDDRVIYTTNYEWERAAHDAITVGEVIASDESERSMVRRFAKSQEGLFSGYCPNFDRLFPSNAEKRFWIRCFLDTAQWIQLGRIPHGEPESAARRIFIAYWCGDILRALIRRVDDAPPPEDQDSVCILKTKGPEGLVDYSDMQQRYWAKRRIEADDRGVLEAETLPDGRIRCAYCQRIFTRSDEHSWDGERHRDCLTRLKIAVQ